MKRVISITFSKNLYDNSLDKHRAFKCKVPVVQTIHNFRLLCPAATLYRDNHICEDCISNGLRCAIKHKCYRKSFLQTLISVLIIKINRILGTYKKLNYICLTEFNKKKLLQLNRKNKKFINEDKIFIKPNFVNIERNIIPYEQRKNQFVFVGRLDKLKGINILFDSWKKIEEIKMHTTPELIVCGIGPEEEFCKEYIIRNNLRHVKLMGFVENFKIMDIISESKALILPTQWYEGFPMTIVESMSCGTPIVGSDIGNVGSLIINDVNGYKFNRNSIDDLVNSIISIKDMTVTIKNIYKDMYTSDTNYRSLSKIYKNIRYIKR